MARIKDITGNRYGKLVAIKYTRSNDQGRAMWLFKCDCGNEIEKPLAFTTKGKKTGANGCGCSFHRKSDHDYYKTHKKLTMVHAAMKQRCLNSGCKDYPNYGGRGISICDEWLGLKFFCEWAIKSGYREGLTIERVNVGGDYCPDNCTWVENKLQGRNRTNTHFFSIGDISGDIRFWSERSGIPYYTLRGRLLNYGMSIEEATARPVGRWVK